MLYVKVSNVERRIDKKGQKEEPRVLPQGSTNKQNAINF